MNETREALQEKWPDFPYIKFVADDGFMNIALLSPYEVAGFLEPIIKARIDTALDHHRKDWASWIDGHGLYVGTEPLPQDQIIEALLRDEPPFGSFANPDIEVQP